MAATGRRAKGIRNHSPLTHECRCSDPDDHRRGRTEHDVSEKDEARDHADRQQDHAADRQRIRGTNDERTLPAAKQRSVMNGRCDQTDRRGGDALAGRNTGRGACSRWVDRHVDFGAVLPFDVATLTVLERVGRRPRCWTQRGELPAVNPRALPERGVWQRLPQLVDRLEHLARARVSQLVGAEAAGPDGQGGTPARLAASTSQRESPTMTASWARPSTRSTAV